MRAFYILQVKFQSGGVVLLAQHNGVMQLEGASMLHPAIEANACEYQSGGSISGQWQQGRVRCCMTWFFSGFDSSKTKYWFETDSKQQAP